MEDTIGLGSAVRLFAGKSAIESMPFEEIEVVIYHQLSIREPLAGAALSSQFQDWDGGLGFCPTKATTDLIEIVQYEPTMGATIILTGV